MRTVRTTVVALALALTGWALAQAPLWIAIGETLRGTIPTEEIDHVYLLDLPAGVPSVTIAVTAGGLDADLAVRYLPTGEEVFLDLSIEPDPSFTMRAPRAGRYEIVVKNLLWQALPYELTVVGEAPAMATSGSRADGATAGPEAGWFVAEAGAAVGPLPESELLQRIASGTLAADDLVWRPGFDAWTRAEATDEFGPRFVPAVVPPPLPAPVPPPPVAPTAPAAPAAPAAPTEAPAAPTDAPAAPPAATGWVDVRADHVCLSVPAEWTDLGERVRGFLEEEGVTVLGVWSAGPDLQPMLALVVLYDMSPAQLDEGLGGLASDAALIDERAADVAAAPGVWRTYAHPVEGRVWMGHRAAPNAAGAYLVVMGTEGMAVSGQYEATLRAIFDGLAPCADDAASPPTPPAAATGAITFTLQGATYGFPAIGMRDPTTDVTLIGGGDARAAVSLTFLPDAAMPGLHDARSAGATFIFQWVDGPPPFAPNVPVTPTYMAMPGYLPIELTIETYEDLGGAIRGSFSGAGLAGSFAVPHVPFTGTGAPTGP